MKNFLNNRRPLPALWATLPRYHGGGENLKKDWIKKTFVFGMSALMTAFLVGGVRADSSFGQAGDYLLYGAGARSLAMGGAYTAVADDASAEYWNPAALAFLDEYQFQTMYAPFTLDSSLYYLALGAPLGPNRGTLAVSDLMLRSTGFQGRDELNLATGGNGTVSNNALSLSYGKSFFDLWSVGARMRFLQQNVLGDSGSAIAMGLSAYSLPIHGMSAGMSLSNLNRPKITLAEEADIFRPNARMGVAYRAPWDRFILSMDMNKTERQSPYFVLGGEYNPVPLLSLRAGWDQNQTVTAGFGLTIRSARFDYAYGNQDNLGATNKVSLTLRWGNIYRAKISPEGLAQGSNSIYIEGLKNEVTFRVDVPRLKIAHWTLIVTDEDGRVVRTLSEQSHPGQKVVWDMTDESGRPVKRGLYKYRFAVEYKTGRMWEEEGPLRLDYKFNSIPDVELRLRAPEGVEGAEPSEKPLPAGQAPATEGAIPVPGDGQESPN